MHTVHSGNLATTVLILLTLLIGGCSSVVGHQYIKTDDNGKITALKRYYSQQNNEYEVVAGITGNVTLADDAFTVKSLAKESFINIHNVQTGSTLKIAEQNGRVIHTLLHHQQHTTPNTKQIENYMLSLFNNTPLLAEQRVNGLIENMGLAAALNQVESAQNNETKAAYVSAISQHALPSNVQEKVLAVLASISSDYEQRKTALYFVENQTPLSESMWVELFEALDEMHSDYELRSFLTSVATQLPDSDVVQSAFFNATKTIGSDYEKYRLFSEVVNLQPAFKTADILHASSDIGSDYEAYRLISDIAEHLESQEDVNALLEFLQSIGSDYEMSRAFEVLPYDKMTQSQTAACLATASDHIGSDYELAKVLVHIHKATPFKETLSEDIKMAMKTMGSDNEKIKVYEVL